MLIPQSRQRFTQELPESCTPIPSNWLARTTSRSTIDSWRFAERPISMWWVPGEKPFTTDWERIWRQEVSVEIWEIAMWFQSFDSFLDQKRPMRLAAHFHGDINHHNQHHGHHGSSKFPIKIRIWFSTLHWIPNSINFTFPSAKSNWFSFFLLADKGSSIQLKSDGLIVWKASDWVSTHGMDNFFEMRSGVLTVKESGLYLIYAQVSFVYCKNIPFFCFFN